MTKLAIGIDLHRCIGCNTCALACKMQNNVPDGMRNRVLTEVRSFDSAEGTHPNLRAPICRWRASIARTRRASGVPRAPLIKTTRAAWKSTTTVHRLPYVHGRLPL
ncbi:MAG: hypothetical protein ACLUW6_07660 [Coriobacteriaceae bacterium]